MIIYLEKYEFSKEDYLMYKNYFDNKAENIEMIRKTNQKHDKSFKSILKSEKEMTKVLKQYVGMEVKEEELEKSKDSFITKNFKKRESDIIYKIK